MSSSWNVILWNQFGAALDMLENAIRACPADLWGNLAEKPGRKEKNEVWFWYLAFHTVFFTDYYLTEGIPTEKDYLPPPPFSLSEFEDGGLPDQVFTKDEVLSYLDQCRSKLERLVTYWAGDEPKRSSGIQYREDMSVAELLLYNMRHVQHHAAQLNLLLRQSVDSAPDWVSRTKARYRSQP